jgi:hypothetical protein
MDKWDFLKLKNLYTTKEMVSKLKRPPTELEKIFSSCTSDKGLITRIYSEQIKKWATELNRTFSKEEIQMDKKNEKMLTISSIKEMQIKTTLRFYLTPVRKAIIKNNTNNRCWHGCGEKRTLIHC